MYGSYDKSNESIPFDSPVLLLLLLLLYNYHTIDPVGSRKVKSSDRDPVLSKLSGNVVQRHVHILQCILL